MKKLLVKLDQGAKTERYLLQVNWDNNTVAHWSEHDNPQSVRITLFGLIMHFRDPWDSGFPKLYVLNYMGKAGEAIVRALRSKALEITLVTAAAPDGVQFGYDTFYFAEDQLR